MAHQEVMTVFRELVVRTEQNQWLDYPELKQFFDKGYHIEAFQQMVIGNERYLITFIFAKEEDEGK